MKTLLLITSSIITITPISNYNFLTNNYVNENKKMIIENNINNDQENDLAKLKNWHNGLSIEQDAQAKKEYTDAMIIKTTKAKSANSFDTYSITFDNKKLQAMLKEKLFNQDAYNIAVSEDTSITLTTEANEIVTLPTNDKSNIQIRAFQSQFYIENNQMHFVDKSHQNPYAINLNKILYNKNPIQITGPQMIGAIMSWEDMGRIDVWESKQLVSDLINMINNGDSAEIIDSWFWDLVMQMIARDMPDLDILLIDTGLLSNDNANFKNSFSQYFFLNSLEKNLDKIKSVNSKYNNGVSETFYFFGLYMDPNSITAIPPMNTKTEINDKDKAGYTNKGKTITNEYDNDPLLNYYGYDSLWQYLNTQGEAFNLNKIFKSYVGVLGKYNNLNYTFHHLEATSILKPYLNNWVTLTKASWTNSNWETSLAQMQMMISDNPSTKTIEFNFKSILCNVNTFDTIGNEMYY